MAVFILIILFIDMQLLTMLWYEMAPLMGLGPSTVSPNEDADVAKERHRINDIVGGRRMDVVTIDGLTKVTSNTIMTGGTELNVVTLDGLTKVTSNT